MKKVIEAIESFFEKNEWKYQYNEEKKIFVSGINMNNVLGDMRMYISLEKNSYDVGVKSPSFQIDTLYFALFKASVYYIWHGVK